jgi:acetoin utilization deacetylase AcuC-like enzyme
MLSRLTHLVSAGRVLMMLEGGYDLEALKNCTSSSLAALVDARLPDVEPPTNGSSESAHARVHDVRRHLASLEII